ncbi:MAG: type II toxin-antitoxin system HicA family toxin [Chloroflexi bacterium]|nr:type II toxin-antitoxin system HicA family toxin [Chloroflexota bacterium]
MRQRLPALKPREVIAALTKAGFEVRRQTGSHVIMYRVGFRRPISIPQHPGDLPQGTLRVIIREAGLTMESFLSLL